MRGLTGRIRLQIGGMVMLIAPLLAVPAWAETRQALVIAGRAAGQEIGQPARDALAVSRALLAAGFDVRRLENPALLPDAPVQRPDVMLVYVSADLAESDGQTGIALSSGPVALAQLASRYPAAQQLLLVESCAVEPATGAAPAAASERGPDAPARGLIAQSSGAGRECAGATRLTTVLLSALEQPGRELADSLSAAGLPVTTGVDWTGFTALAARPTAEGGGTLVLDQPLRPVTPITPSARPGALSAAGSAATGGVQIFNAAAPVQPLTGDRQARPTGTGLPEPSIIVGERPREDGVTPPADSLAGEALGTSFEERRRIREEDPQVFASLLESGAFDPPADQMASAIQTELQRMNCYTGQIDGDWGNGSRQAVDRYFQQATGTPATREAEVSLFRQIALSDDLRCPDVVVQPVVRNTPSAGTRQPAAARSTPARNTATPRATTRQPTPQRQQTAPPAAATTQPRINPNALGSGIFR